MKKTKQYIPECPMADNETLSISGRRYRELYNSSLDLKKARALIERQRAEIEVLKEEKREQRSISQRIKKMYLKKGRLAEAYVVTLLRKRLFLA